MPRTLTGITPSGTLHIGNYFGAMRPAIDAQARGDCFYFIADYHSMTSVTERGRAPRPYAGHRA
jgi:tryptophanyl-tRNA synthetase